MYSPGKKLEQAEKETILAAYQFYRGNKTHTANALGISIRTLDSKLEMYKAEEKKAPVVPKTKEERLAATRALMAKMEKMKAESRNGKTVKPETAWKPVSATTRAQDIAAEKAKIAAAPKQKETAATRRVAQAKKDVIERTKKYADLSAKKGRDLESASPVSEKHAVSVQKRGEVQKVLPEQTVAGHSSPQKR